MRWSFPSGQPLKAVVVLLAVWGVLAQGPARAQSLLGTGHQDHLWFVIDSTQSKGGYDLCHYAIDLPGAFFKQQSWLAQKPEAIASWENRVWVVFPANGSAKTRQVFTIAVQKNPAFGVYVSMPAGRLDIAAALPGEGELISLVGTASGPVALMSGGPSAAPKSAVLLQLVNDHWSAIELPADANIGRGSLLVPSDGQAGELSIFAPASSDRQQCVRHSRSSTGAWRSAPYPLDISKSPFAVSAAGHAAAIVHGPTADQIEITYLRPEAPIPLTALPQPKGAWTLVGLRDGFRLLELGAGKLQMRRIGLISGEVLDAEVMAAQALAT